MPWYGRRRVQRWLVSVAILIAGVWATNASRPIWPRYWYYRIQQQAATYILGPSQVLVCHSATLPYVHIPGPADQFLGTFWTTASRVGLGSATVNVGGRATAATTPIFCGLRTTRRGNRQIVQAYSSGTPLGVEPAVTIVLLTTEWRGMGWVLTGRTEHLYGSPLNWGFVVLPTNASDVIQVSAGVANPGDASEVDVPVSLNGRPATIRFHVTETISQPPALLGLAMDRGAMSQPPSPIGIATDGGALSRAFSQLRGPRAIHCWDWPFTGKQSSP